MHLFSKISNLISKYETGLALFILCVYFAGFPTSIIMLFQGCFILKILFFNKKDIVSIKEMLVVFFLGAEPILILLPLVFLIKFFTARMDRILYVNKKLFYFILYSFVLFSISLIQDFTFLNYFFWLLIFFGFISTYFFAKSLVLSNVDKSSLVSFFLILVFVQMIVVLSQSLLFSNYEPGDWAMGTLFDAHKLGFIFLFAGIYFLFEFFRCFSLNNFLCFFISCIFLYLCDAKAIVMSLFLASMLLCIFMTNTKQFKFIFPSIYIRLVFFTIAIIVAVSIFNFNFIFLDDFLDLYVYGELSSSKFTLYNIVWVEFFDKHIFEWLFGTGPGTLGSKASNMLSGDILFKTDSFISTFIPVSSSYWTRTYMVGLYDFDVFNNISNVSAVLTYPFAGFISIKAELGCFGLIFFSYIYFSMSNELLFSDTSSFASFKKALYIFLVIFYCSLLFDNYHEQLVISGILFLLLGAFSKRDLISS